MIISFLLNLIVLILGVIFSWLPDVTALPTIGGYDIDSALVSGMGYLHRFFQTFWMLDIMFTGFLALMSYYLLKIVLRFFIGHRSPTS